jgi:hypothetical protein
MSGLNLDPIGAACGSALSPKEIKEHGIMLLRAPPRWRR